jgi:diamine N-acetyltransferase
MKIALKALEPSDVPLLLKWENDQSIWDLSKTVEPFSKFKLDTYIKQSLSFDSFGLKELRLMIHRVVNEVEDITEPIGTIEMFDFDSVNKHAGIGILVHKDYQGQGFGKPALDEFLTYLAKRLQVHSVVANVSANNIQSIKFFEAYGFTKVGELKEFLFENGKFVSQLIYQYVIPTR